MAGASRAKAARLMSRWLGVGLSLNRIGFGSTYLLHPARGGRAWIGRAAGDPATTVIHAGTEPAAAEGSQRLGVAMRGAGAWIGAQVLADAADFASTLAVRERLPPRGARFALLVAGVSVVAGSAAAFSLAGR